MVACRWLEGSSGSTNVKENTNRALKHVAARSSRQNVVLRGKVRQYTLLCALQL